jgi:alkyldihydroxyacetonephosphate synthase
VNPEKRTRRLGGWGFQGESFPPPPQLLEWLEERLGPAEHELASISPKPPSLAPEPLPELPIEISDDPMDRLSHARGQGLVDVIRLRAGLVPALPDGVGRPSSANQVEATLRVCGQAGVRVIPWGGGTSVTGGVNVSVSADPILTLDLERMAGLTALNDESGLATFGPGATGPAVEAALAEHQLTLGHFPQSWELSTVGGWVVTRSAGQESLGYGRIEDLVAGLVLVAPAGRLALPTLPASAAGPDLKQLVMGSEGRLGVVTRVTLRVRPRPAETRIEGALFPDLERGLAAVRDLVVRGVLLTLVRLSDPPETEVAMAVGLAASSAAPLLRRYLTLRGIGENACLMLYGSSGDRERVRDALGRARALIGRHRGVALGRRPGRKWLHDRFRHPYLREGLLDLGYATDTLETAVPWSTVIATRRAVSDAIASALEGEDERVTVLCHVSHPYRDGTSLYFTFFFRCAADPEHTIHRWAVVKRAANRALVDGGATLSHHHGIGQWHSPWYEQEVGPDGVRLVEAAARRLDPNAILNPHVLLDPEDRLEV